MSSVSLALGPRTTSAQLLAARDALAALVDRWDAAAAAPLFDRTFTYYKPLEKIRVELEGLRARHGRCRADEVTPENALRGKARLSCDRGSIEVTVTLTSEVPALIQSLSFESALPPDAAGPPQAKASAEPRPAPAARGKCPR